MVRMDWVGRTSEELIDEFGLDPGPVVKFMLTRGYCLQDDLHWLKPEAYRIPSAKEWNAMRYLAQVHGYGAQFSVDIKKPIKQMCELKDSHLLRCHVNAEAESGYRKSDPIRLRRRRMVKEAAARQKGAAKKNEPEENLLAAWMQAVGKRPKK